MYKKYGMKSKIRLLPLLLLLLLPLPTAIATPSPDEEPPLRDKIAQMLLVGFRGTTLTKDAPIYRDVRERHIGGVILFDYDVPTKSRVRNIQSPAQLRQLIDDLQALSALPLLVGIDQEGGRVSRLKTAFGFPPTVTAKVQGAKNDLAFTAFYAAQTARTLAEAGINLNFAPCVDVDVRPDCPVIGRLERSFSSDTATVARHAAIWIAEHERRRVLTCLKHFPGHGSATGDTHAGSVDVTATWSEAELAPYRALVATGAVRLVMTAHVFNARLDPAYPATMSKAILTGLLRRQLGFTGLIVSDDLAMGAIADHYRLEDALEMAINAGVDILCLSNNGAACDPDMAQKAITAIEQLVRAGRIAPQRIDESYQRILSLKRELRVKN
jgi:beta-N-acetylhexosaminidase